MLRTEITDFLPAATQALRREVFMDEQGFTYEFDDTDHTALHITLYDGETAAACCRIFPDGPEAWHVGRVAVRKVYRGQGLGAAVMVEAEKAAAARGASKMALSAQKRAAEFYRKLGYTQLGEEYLDEHCPHVYMEKQLA